MVSQKDVDVGGMSVLKSVVMGISVIVVIVMWMVSVMSVFVCMVDWCWMKVLMIRYVIVIIGYVQVYRLVWEFLSCECMMSSILSVLIMSFVYCVLCIWSLSSGLISVVMMRGWIVLMRVVVLMVILDVIVVYIVM